MSDAPAVHQLSQLRDRARVFADRTAAGAALAQMLQGYHDSNALILAIPAGGVPVAAEIAIRLHLPLDLLSQPEKLL